MTPRQELGNLADELRGGCKLFDMIAITNSDVTKVSAETLEDSLNFLKRSFERIADSIEAVGDKLDNK